MSKNIQDLTNLIAELPGLGPRQARRVVQYLLRANGGYKKKLTDGISSLSNHVSQCLRCYRYDEINSEKLCTLCADQNRDTAVLMVVEKDVDAEGVEVAGIFKGGYFILGGLLSLTNSRKSFIEPRIPQLQDRILKEKPDEIILAFATTPEGDFTARELKETISVKFSDMKVTILGRGLSLGAEIEYADQETLRSALQGRSEEF